MDGCGWLGGRPYLSRKNTIQNLSTERDHCRLRVAITPVNTATVSLVPTHISSSSSNAQISAARGAPRVQNVECGAATPTPAMAHQARAEHTRISRRREDRHSTIAMASACV
jgi:hypothetical protein